MSQQPQKEEPLCPLREDLKLLPGPALAGGSPTWTLHDPVRNKFFRLGRREFEILARWSVADCLVTASQVTAAVNSQTTAQLEHDEVNALQNFFAQHCLLAPGTVGSLSVLTKRREKSRHPALWLLHNYIFFRIPLLKPEHFLKTTLPWARLLVSKPCQYLLLVGAITGLLMVSRQWQAFLHTFSYFFTLQGFFYYALALIFVKIFHELGHAYTARHFGVRVPTMGLAFIVLWPMLYSDTTESWKLTDRKARMRIVAAGIIVELVFALVATLLWSFAEDGPFRSACFIVATATWLTSLFMNLSPFMRFDGYYLFSDYLDIPNLQDRAFTLGKWYLRKIIIGLDLPCPELFSPGRTRLLICYAYATWIYRLFLFTTIALVVYHLFFKVLGVALFAVEIIWFLVMPVIKELDIWWLHRTQVGYCNRHLILSLTLTFCLLALFFLPWNARIRTTGLVLPLERQQIYPPFAAQIAALHVTNGQEVSKGELLLSLQDPFLDLQIDLAEKKIASLKAQLERQITNSELLAPRQIMQGWLVETMTTLEGYRQQQARLRVTAPISGLFVDMAANLRPELWINETLLLGRVITKNSTVIVGYLAEDQLSVVQPGTEGLFYLENRDLPPLHSRVDTIQPTSQRTISEPYLASVYGGELPTSYSASRGLVSHQSLYRLTLLAPELTTTNSQVLRGRLLLKGKRMSFFDRLKNRVMAVLIRESGF